LLDKLYRGDFANISDDNFGRMDLEAVVMAFSTDERAREKCDIFGGKGLDGAQTTKFLSYIKFLNTDRDTGTFPSAQFLLLGTLSGLTDYPGMWALDPNMLAMALEIEKGCNSDRVFRIRTNLLKLLDERIVWYSKDQSSKIGIMRQTTTKITQQSYRSIVEKDLALPAQAEAMRQIASLESRGAQLVDCEYGPTNPDSTGSQTLRFWYGNPVLTMNDFLKVSRKHPLGNYGDDGVSACPKTLLEAKVASADSLKKGRGRLDSSALAPGPSSDRLTGDPLYQIAKARWIAFQTSREPADRQQAEWGKAQLLKTYGDSCEAAKKAGVSPGGNLFCLIVDQVKYEFQGIPDVPLTGRVYAAAGGIIINSAQPSAAPQFSPVVLRVGLQLSVINLEMIDLTSQDETRRYRAQLDQPAVANGATVLPQGTEVLLRIARSKNPQMPNVATVNNDVVSVTVNGKPTPVTTNFSSARIPANPRGVQGQMAARTRLNFAIQALGN
jgi:hypothetical protein